MRISVKAKPSAKEQKIEKIDSNSYIISVKEPPIQGKANKAIIAAFAEYFNKPSWQISIVSGYTSKQKIIEVGEI